MSVTTMIDEGAEGCNALTCAGWALLQGTYQIATLGFAAVHDPVEDAYDRGEVSRGEYWGKGVAGGLGIATLNAVSGRVGGTLVAGATTATGRIATAGAVGAATGVADDTVMQAVHLSTGIQEEYDLARTVQAGSIGAIAGGGSAGLVDGVVAARRVHTARAAERANQQSRPVTATEGADGAPELLVDQQVVPSNGAAPLSQVAIRERVLANIEASQASSNFKLHVELEGALLRGLNAGGGNRAYRSILTEATGPAPDGMFDPHAHHILFKKGQASQRELVLEGQRILREVGIHPEFAYQNLTWAPNRVVGQHSTSTLAPLVEDLRAVQGSRLDIEAVLQYHGELAAQRRL
jgi:hypothetical protein